jgi:hypothetical protein
MYNYCVLLFENADLKLLITWGKTGWTLIFELLFHGIGITEKPSYSLIDCNVFLHIILMCYSVIFKKKKSLFSFM